MSSQTKLECRPYCAITRDQLTAIKRVTNPPGKNCGTLLVANMGAGKTVIALTAAATRLRNETTKRVLVCAPMRVASEVWAAEHLQWAHLAHLRVLVISGHNAMRTRTLARAEDYDIIVIHFDILPWARSAGIFKLCDALIIDESTKLKSAGVQFKSIRHAIRGFSWRLIMTGKPVSENWQQIFYQMMLTDGGWSLGTVKEAFMGRYFFSTDYNKRKWALKQDAEQKISDKIAPYIHVVRDYRVMLPLLDIQRVYVELPPVARSIYDAMQGAGVASGVIASTAVVQQNKCEQISAGFMYDDEYMIPVHDAKTDKMCRLVSKLGTQRLRAGANSPSALYNTLIVYQYTEQLDEIYTRFPRADSLTGLSRSDTSELVERWNAGLVNVLAVHPRSVGHGLNLAKGGRNIIWLGPIWSCDLFDQTIARLWRRGQKHDVHVWVIESLDTVDQDITERLYLKQTLDPLFAKYFEVVHEV